MKRNYAIDIMRLIASIMVVAIHTDPLFSHSEISNYFIVAIISRVAVPFFFMVSGYFFMLKRLSLTTKAVKTNQLIVFIKNIGQLYLIWSLVYLPLQILIWYRSNGTIDYWLKYLQSFIFEGSYYTLWYLPGLLFAVLISSFLFNYFKDKQIVMITISLYIIGLLGQTYYDINPIKNLYDLYYPIFLTTRNGLFFGTFFVSLGMLIAKNKYYLSVNKASIGIFISFVLLIIEAILFFGQPLTKGVGMWLMLIPLMFFLFLFLLSLSIKKRSAFRVLRPLSILIYTTHGLFMIGLNRLFNISSLLYFIVVLVLSIILSFIIIFIGERNKLIKRMYA